jgi:glycosyltransferase involved in cell wall biosynthesis
VIIPNFNRESHLPRCLQSLLAQSFTDWRAVVGDNASTDGSVEVVRSFADPRLQLLCRPHNVGYIRNTNLLIHDADTDFLAILHSDDWWEPDFLEQMVSLLEEAPEAVMAVSAVNLVFDRGPVDLRCLAPPAAGPEVDVLPAAAATRIFVRTWPFLTPSDVLAPTAVYRRFAGFDESLPYSTDWLMWLRAASFGPVAFTKRPLVNNRRHSVSVTGQSEANALWADEWIRITKILEREWQAGGLPYPGASRELAAMNALRFIMKSFELYEAGNRSAAIKLTRLAQETASSRTYRAGALLLRAFERMATPALATSLRRLAAAATRTLSGRGRATGAASPPESAFAYILTAVRQSE